MGLGRYHLIEILYGEGVVFIIECIFPYRDDSVGVSLGR